MRDRQKKRERTFIILTASSFARRDDRTLVGLRHRSPYVGRVCAKPAFYNNYLQYPISSVYPLAKAYYITRGPERDASPANVKQKKSYIEFDLGRTAIQLHSSLVSEWIGPRDFVGRDICSVLKRRLVLIFTRCDKHIVLAFVLITASTGQFVNLYIRINLLCITTQNLSLFKLKLYVFLFVRRRQHMYE